MKNKKVLMLISEQDSGDDSPLSACREFCAQLHLAIDCSSLSSGAEMAALLAKSSADYDAFIISPRETDLASHLETNARDAVVTASNSGKPIIEVHERNIHAGEAACGMCLQIADAKIGLVAGMGIHSYQLAIRAVARKLGSIGA